MSESGSVNAAAAETSQPDPLLALRNEMDARFAAFQLQQQEAAAQTAKTQQTMMELVQLIQTSTQPPAPQLAANTAATQAAPTAQAPAATAPVQEGGKGAPMAAPPAGAFEGAPTKPAPWQASGAPLGSSFAGYGAPPLGQVSFDSPNFTSELEAFCTSLFGGIDGPGDIPYDSSTDLFRGPSRQAIAIDEGGLVPVERPIQDPTYSALSSCRAIHTRTGQWTPTQNQADAYALAYTTASYLSQARGPIADVVAKLDAMGVPSGTLSAPLHQRRSG